MRGRLIGASQEALSKHLGNPTALISDKEVKLLLANQEALSMVEDYDVRRILDKIEEKRQVIQKYASILTDMETALREVRAKRRKELDAKLEAMRKEKEAEKAA